MSKPVGLYVVCAWCATVCALARNRLTVMHVRWLAYSGACASFCLWLACACRGCQQPSGQTWMRASESGCGLGPTIAGASSSFDSSGDCSSRGDGRSLSQGRRGSSLGSVNPSEGVHRPLSATWHQSWSQAFVERSWFAVRLLRVLSVSLQSCLSLAWSVIFGGHTWLVARQLNR